jgi:uncharacterized membrane protein
MWRKNASVMDKLVPFAWGFLAYALLSCLTFYASGHLIHISMIWNLFLAFLPLIFSSLLGCKLHKVARIALMVLWLLFIPNAFYVLTDFIHISDLSYYVGGYYDFKNVDYAKDAVVYLELINITIGYLLALAMGLTSFKNIHQKFLAKHHSVVLIIFLLIGYAMYIGRFLRLNSWDIFSPLKLWERVAASCNWFGLVMTLLFAGYVAAVYGGFRWLARLKK